MKAIILSDIHGNLEYMKLIDDYISKENIDKLIVLGDLFGIVESESNGVAKILNKYKDIVVCVKGNCDMDNDDRIEFIQEDAKEIYLDQNKFIITHGHLIPMLYDFIGDNLVLQGHTHVYNLSGQYLNPGSVGRPRVNGEHTFMLYEDNKLQIIDISNMNVIKERIL